MRNSYKNDNQVLYSENMYRDSKTGSIVKNDDSSVHINFKSFRSKPHRSGVYQNKLYNQNDSRNIA